MFNGLSETLISTLNQKQNPTDSGPKKTNKNINDRVPDVLSQNALFEQGDSADEAADSVNTEMIDQNFSMFSDEEVDQVEAHGYDEDFDFWDANTFFKMMKHLMLMLALLLLR